MRWIACLLLIASGLFAQCPNSPSFITTTGVVNETALPAKPSVGSAWSDPTFNNCIKRVSNATTLSYDHPVPWYSKLQGWNSDGTRLLLAGGFVLDATTYALQRTIPSYADPRWSRTDPNTIYFTTGNQFKKIDVRTGVETTLHTFTGYVGFDASEADEELSDDGRWIMFILMGNSGDPTTWRIVSYDIVNDVVSPAINYVQGGCGGGGPAFAQVSHSGTYALLNWAPSGTGRFCGIEAYNISTMAYVGKVAFGWQHMDTTIDSSGVEWMVQFAHCSTPMPAGFDCPSIYKARIPSGYDDYQAGDHTGLVKLMDTSFTSFHGHISGRAPGKDFVLVSTHNEMDTSVVPAVNVEDNDGWVAHEQEITKLYLDSTPSSLHLQRVAHHYSRHNYVYQNCSLSDYWAQPHATLNIAGSLALFGSTWGNNCSAEAYVVNLGPILAATTSTKGITALKGGAKAK